MLTCKEASHLLSQGCERPLGARERWGLRLHLWLCGNCRRFARQLASMQRAMGALRRRAETEANAAGLPVAARERICRALREGRGQPRD